MKRLSRMLFAAALALLAPAFALPAPAFAQAVKDPKPPADIQKEFDAFIAKFRAALKANDSAAVAELTRFPYGYDNPVPDAASFRAKIYPKTFTAKTRACLQRGKAVYERDSLSDHNYSLFCGEEIFLFKKTPTVGFRFVEIGVND